MLSESIAGSRRSEAYPCHEELHKFWRHFSSFWVPNALPTANLSDNPANLWVNDLLCHSIYLLSTTPMIPLICCYINSF